MSKPTNKSAKNNLTIGFVIDDGLDRPDGVQQYVLALGQWMSEQGHDVHYLSGETKRKDLPNVHSMSRNLKVRFNGNTLSTPFPARARYVSEVLNACQFDVLHVQVPYSPFMAARVVKQADKQTVVIGTFHILPYGKLQSLGTKMLGLWLHRSLKRFNAFLGVSSAAKLFAKQSFGVTAQVVPNTVVLSKYKPVTPRRVDKNVRLVFLGRLVDRKGCMELLQALEFINLNKLTKKSYALDVFGRGIDEAKLKTYVAEHHLETNVTFHGFVTEEDKPNALQAADIAVFPATGAESFGIVLIEAMAAGAGVTLGGNNPGYRTVLEPTHEALIEPKNTESFARSLVQFMEDPVLRNRVGKTQQEMVKQYDINIVGEQVLEIYKDCKNQL